MTLTDLEKLEALHAAATPGEWTGDRHDGTVKYRLHSENCECDREEPWNCPHLVLSVDHKNGTSGFRGVHSEENEKLVIALHNAFPALAKALREAWEIAKCRRDEGLDWVQAAFDFQRERDEARVRASIAEGHLRDLCGALQSSIVGKFCVAGESYVKALPRIEVALNAARKKRAALEWGPDVGFLDWHVAHQIAEDHSHNGWRLPTLAELTAQFDYATCKPRDEGWLPEIYWAAEACADVYTREADTAWALWFKHGDQVRGFKDTQAHRVRLVRTRAETSDGR